MIKRPARVLFRKATKHQTAAGSSLRYEILRLFLSSNKQSVLGLGDNPISGGAAEGNKGRKAEALIFIES